MTETSETRTVLLVDDDLDFLEQMEIQFHAAGFQTLTASNQKDAEALLTEQRPDLAVLDLMMENMDAGFVLSYKVKKVDPTIPVILVTAVASETSMDFEAVSDDQRSWVKADAMISKPVRFEQLQREIDRLLG